MAFKNASAFGFSITLPVGDRQYTIQSPSVEIGHALVQTTVTAGQATQLAELLEDLPEGDPAAEEIRAKIRELASELQVPDSMERGYLQDILGDAYDEMKANGEPYEVVKLAAATVSVWVINGREAAEAYWNAGGRPPRRAPRDRRKRKTGTSK